MIAAIDVEVRASASCCSRARPSGSPPATRSAWSVATAPARHLAGSVPVRPSPPPERSLAPVRSGTCRRIRGPGDLDVLARDRILSARGSTPSSPACAAPSSRSSPDADEARSGMRRYGRLESEFIAQGGYAAEKSSDDRGQPGAARPRPRPAAANAFRRTAPAGRVVADPVLRRRDTATRRAHEPPRRGLDRVATRLPAGLQGRDRCHQPRRGAARPDREQGLPPRRHPGARCLQRGLEDLPAAA